MRLFLRLRGMLEGTRFIDFLQIRLVWDGVTQQLGWFGKVALFVDVSVVSLELPLAYFQRCLEGTRACTKMRPWLQTVQIQRTR